MKHLSSPRRALKAARQQGYTLIELSIALAIISVIIVGSLVGVQRILANNRANNLLAEIPRINAALVGAAVNSTSFAKITTTEAAALGAFSPSSVNYVNGAPEVSNAFGGRLFVQGNEASFDGVKRGYVVVATGVPVDMCATVVNGLAPLAQALWVDTATDAASFDTPLPTVPTPLIKGPEQTATIELTTLAKECRPTGSSTATVHAFVAI